MTGSQQFLLMKGVSESLAGRVEFVDLSAFDVEETGCKTIKRLWIRGGFPRSFLAANNEDSYVWREGFIRTFLERDLPQFGVRTAASTMYRFWSMLAHYHGQIWNASRIATAMSISDKTTRSYLIAILVNP